jgi:tetratricopeptide (TPR) repeat protein
MKRLSVAAVCVLLFAGCRNADQKQMRTIPALAAHSAKPEPAQGPYYYGLIEEYQSTLAGDPHNLAAMIGLANAYYEIGAWGEAIRHYGHALELQPRNADLHTDLGRAYRNIGAQDRALAEYRRALEYDPGHVNARYNMGIAYAFDFRDYALAASVWEDLLRIAPNHPRADYMRTCIVSFRKNVKKGHL